MSAETNAERWGEARGTAKMPGLWEQKASHTTKGEVWVTARFGNGSEK